MAIVTYSNADSGFGVTYDDALLTHSDDPADLPLRAAWTHRIPTVIAAAVLFTSREATAASIDSGRAPSLLLTTDGAPLQPGVLGMWDWDEVAPREGLAFLERTGAYAADSVGMYWRGFPVLQYTTAPPADADPPAPVECLSLLYTPTQTFSMELVVPVVDLDAGSSRLQDIADGFFLLPIAREGHVRTGHQRAWSQRLEAGHLEDDRGVLTG
ncbi:MAG: hypothetical protein IH629_00385 [Thermoleophilia bacterium]|nr:hypothetical protein [Thermoleophilia bacterium]